MYHKRDINKITDDCELLIYHYGNKCGGEEMRAQLWAFLWELVVKKRAISKRYVAVALRNEFIRYAKILQEKPRFLHPCEWWERADEWENIEPNIAIKNAVENMSEPLRHALILHRICGFTFEEIAAAKGCTRQAVCNAEKRALDILRRAL